MLAAPALARDAPIRSRPNACTEPRRGATTLYRIDDGTVWVDWRTAKTLAHRRPMSRPARCTYAIR
jgi:hypothetical protein